MVVGPKCNWLQSEALSRQYAIRTIVAHERFAIKSVSRPYEYEHVPSLFEAKAVNRTELSLK